MKRVRFLYKNEAYFATPFEDNPQKTKGDHSDLFMYRIYDENEKPVACIAFSWAGTTRDGLINPQFKNNKEEETTYLFLIPHLPLYIDTAKKLYTECFQYVFNNEYEGLETNGYAYNLKTEKNLLFTRQKIVFGKQPSEEQIRKEILTTLYTHWLDYPENFVHTCTLKLFIPVEGKKLNRNLLFLSNEEFIKCQILNNGIVSHSKILNPGIKYIENPLEYNEKQNSNIKDNINISTSGKNSPIIINSQNVDIAFSEIFSKIESRDFPNKQEASRLLVELESKIKKDDKDPNKIKKLLEKIKKMAPLINEEVLKHPLIGHLVSQILTRTTG